MAKRLSIERPYTPLDASLVSDVLSQVPQPEPAVAERSPKPIRSSRTRSASSDQSLLRTQVEREAKAPRDESRARVVAAAPSSLQERMNSVARVKMSRREKRELEAFVARLAATLDATILPSNVLRALSAIVQNAESAIAEQARRHLPISRPSNNDVVAYAEFEQRLVQILDAAIRRATPVR